MDAVISGPTGIALLFKPDGIYAICVDRPSDPPMRRSPSDLPYLLGERYNLEFLESTDLETVREKLAVARSAEIALTLTLNLLDGELPAHYRRKVASSMESIILNDHVYRRVCGALYSRPLPPEADLAGARAAIGGASSRLRQLLDDLSNEHIQYQIRLIGQSWDEVTALDPSADDLWVAIRAGGVRRGLFWDLVRHLRGVLSLPDFLAHHLFAPEFDQSADQIWFFQKWIAALAGMMDERGRLPRTLEAWREACGATVKVLLRIGSEAQDRLEFDQAKRCYQQSLTLAERVFGDESLESMHSVCSIADLHRIRGDYRRADEMLTTVLNRLEASTEADEAMIAKVLSDFGVLRYYQARFQQSVEYHQQSLRIRRKLLGEANLETAESLDNLGGSYCAQGDYAEAERLMTDALQIREMLMGPLHPEVAISLNNLAYLYHTARKVEDALSLYKKSLTILSKNYGENNYYSSIVYNNIANLLLELNNEDEAEDYFGRSAAILRALFGDKHPMTTSVTSSMLQTRKRLLSFAIPDT